MLTPHIKMVSLSNPSKIAACVTVINVKFIVQQAFFLGEVTKQGLLIADAHTFDVVQKK